MSGYSTDDLLDFLDYLVRNGLVNKSTGSSRRVACGKVFEVLDGDERKDVRSISLEDVMTRFGNIQGAKYTPQSLSVYRSRLGRSIQEFLRYKRDPAAFKSAGGSLRTKKSVSVPSETLWSSCSISAEDDVPSQKGVYSELTASPQNMDAINVPIALGGGRLVQVVGLPVDLTEEEAQKIANVVKAMVQI